MKIIKVLGSGCAKCTKTAQIIKQVASDMGADVEVLKETSPEAIMNYGVISTPAVLADEQLAHSGSIPERKKIASWLSGAR